MVFQSEPSSQRGPKGQRTTVRDVISGGLLKELGTTMLWVLPIWLLIWVTGSGYWLTMGIIISVLTIRLVWVHVHQKKWPRMLKYLRTVAEVWAFVSVIYVLNLWLQGYGMLGIVALVYGLAAYRVWRSWALYKEGIGIMVEMIKGRGGR